MHEFSIGQTLVKAVLAELDKPDRNTPTLLKACVVVGALRSIVPEYLEQAYGVLTKDTAAEGSLLEVRIAPVAGKCEDCGWRGEMSRGDFTCRSCGSSRAEIVGGKELYLDHLEVEEPEQLLEKANHGLH